MTDHLNVGKYQNQGPKTQKPAGMYNCLFLIRKTFKKKNKKKTKHYINTNL